MKRFGATIFAFMMLVTLISGCRQTAPMPDGKISIVCTIFPQYDWVRQILGDNVGDMELTLLLHNSVDLHSYQPTVDDIISITTCDLIVFVGGESDKWVSDALKSANNPDTIIVNLLETLGNTAKIEEIQEGMDEGDATDDDGPEYDEHVWLSLRNAEIFCSAITDALISLDVENAADYEKNLAAYIAEISALDARYGAAINAASNKTLLFGDRFPFRYLLDDYGLSYYAAFPGCSAETEASFQTIIFLAKKADELNLDTIVVTESADQSIAISIINNTEAGNQQILVLDAMQSVTSGDLQNGVTYLSIMESNLNILKDAIT